MLKKIMLSFFIFTFIPALLMAEENVELEKILVSTDRFGTDTDLTTNNVQIITQEQIQKTSSKKLDEVLSQYVSGVTTTRNSVSDMRPVIGMRGLGNFEQGRTLILLNGVPINKADNGDVNWNAINLKNVEKIEVIKGTGSAMYGNNAMSGIINIITKKPVDVFEGDVSFDFASYQTYEGNLNIGGEINKNLYYNLNALAKTTNGFVTSSDYDQANMINQGYTPTKNYLDEFLLTPKIGYTINELNNVEFESSFYRDYRSEGEAGDDRAQGEFRKFDTDLYRINYKGGVSETTWNISTFYNQEDYYKLYDRPLPKDNTDVNSKRKDYGVLSSIDIPFSDSNNFTTGFDHKQGKVNAGDYDFPGDGYITNKGSIRQYALFVQDEQNLFAESLLFSAGIRYDYAQFLNGATTMSDAYFPFSNAPDISTIQDKNWYLFSPRVAIKYHFNPIVATRFAYSRGFRAPELDDLCRTGYQYVGPKIANPDLKPEKIDTFDIGADINISHGLIFNTDLFYSIGKDFLYYVDTGSPVWTSGYWSTKTYYQKQNIAKVHIVGLEFNANYSLLKYYNVYANYAYANSKIITFDTTTFLSAQNLTGKELRNTPNHVGNIGFNFGHKWINININTKIVGAYFTDDANTSDNKTRTYALLDLKLSTQVLNPIYFAFEIQNIFDQKHTDTENGTNSINGIEYSMADYNPGRFFMFTTGYRF